MQIAFARCTDYEIILSLLGSWPSGLREPHPEETKLALLALFTILASTATDSKRDCAARIRGSTIGRKEHGSH